MSRKLDGLAVLVTRPHQAAEGLVEALRADGALPIVQPALETTRVELDPSALEHLAALEPGDWLVFTSPAAVEHGISQLPTAAAAQNPHCWAVGASTAARLEDHWSGGPVHHPAHGSGVEALLSDSRFCPSVR